MADLIQLSTNLADMEEYEPLPAGMYPAEVRQSEIRHTEKVPNGMVYLQLVVHPDDYPADYDASNAPEGVQLGYARVRLPDGSDRRAVAPFKKLMTALGQSLNTNEFNPDDWVGKNVQVLLSQSEYQGAPVNNVEAVSELASV